MPLFLRLFLLLALPAGLTACSDTLFRQSDNFTRSRINRYWDGDAAVGLRSTRTQASETGFGFPAGMANR